jgi:LPS sulfotransferase NodH
VLIRRRDTLRQAVSLWKALQTQRWRRDSDEEVDGRDLRFSFAAVDHLKLRIDEHNAAWESFFGNCAVGWSVSHTKTSSTTTGERCCGC